MREGRQICTVEQVESPSDDHRLHIALAGELDSATAVDTMVRVSALIGQAPDVVLDFSGVTFVSASALSLIIRLNEGRLETGGSLAIRGARSRDRRVLGWAHLEHLIEGDDDSPAER